MSDVNNFSVSCTQEKGKWSRIGQRWFHESKRFFSVLENYDQYGPILDQSEIGCLGLLVAENPETGRLDFLLQKKTEPGTSDDFEYSTTIQATRSNFERAHNGNEVPLFNEFINRANLLHCSIQIEQTDAYLGKANANIIKKISKNEITELKSHMWISEDKIREIFKVNSNLISMDLRSLLSIFYSLEYTNLWQTLPLSSDCRNYEIFQSGLDFQEVVRRSTAKLAPKIIKNFSQYINRDEQTAYNFNFYDINISRRENPSWIQPLLERSKRVEYQLNVFKSKGEIYLELSVGRTENNEISLFCPARLARPELGNAIARVTFSEEGGRFFRVQNIYSIVIKDKLNYSSSISLLLFIKEYLLPGMQTSIELRSLIFILFMERGTLNNDL